jgi:serine/threonine protein kinase
MEWVDGVSLDDWARLYRPTAEQVLRMLAQLVLALQTLHAQEAVHRDVKDDNVLVRRSDSRVFLTDFGSGVFPGADTLTPPPLPPGTPAYRSPEAWVSVLQYGRTATAAHSAGPGDDIYALGVTACRLVTGAYPELGEPQKDEHGTWRLEPMVLPKALRREGRVEAPLRALILRMLSEHPEQRGTAAQLAQEMERAATSLTASSAPRPRAPLRSWLVAGAAAAVLATWAGWLARGTPRTAPASHGPRPPRPSRRTCAPRGSERPLPLLPGWSPLLPSSRR